MVMFLRSHAKREEEAERKKDYFKFLALEIILEILTRLPVESVLNSKLVCTNWRFVVGHSSFSMMHVHHHLNHSAAESAGKSTRSPPCIIGAEIPWMSAARKREEGKSNI